MGELCLMILMNDEKFEEKLSLGSKKYMRNLVKFNASSGTLMYYFCQ